MDLLNKLYNSNRAQFVAVYGRRRVGKTYLVNEANEAFQGRITYRHAGLSPIEFGSDASDGPLKSSFGIFTIHSFCRE